MVQAVTAAAAIALDNERVQAQAEARLTELRASRERIVAAGDAERRRLERNLHDGAQQRLVALSMLLIACEALANIAKYAQATRASVELSCRDGIAVIEIVDDGIGGADALAGSGLRGLADRVAALDGTLRVTSPPGAGTVVTAEIPYAA